LKKNVKNVKNVKLMTYKVAETSFCPVNVSVKLLRPYFNRRFYVMYVYVIVLVMGKSHLRGKWSTDFFSD